MPLFVATIVGWSGFSVWDWVFMRDHFATMSILRHGIGTLGLIAGIVIAQLVPKDRMGATDKSALVGIVAILAATLSIYATFTVEMERVLYAALAIIVLVDHSFPSFRVWTVAPATGAAVVTYFAIAIVRGIPARDIVNDGTWLVAAELLAIFLHHSIERLTRTAWAQTQVIAHERERSERLLLNVLPTPIAERLKAGESPIADRVPSVTVLFADIVGFTTLSQQKTPEEIVSLLDGIFRELDAIAARQGPAARASRGSLHYPD